MAHSLKRRKTGGSAFKPVKSVPLGSSTGCSRSAESSFVDRCLDGIERVDSPLRQYSGGNVAEYLFGVARVNIRSISDLEAARIIHVIAERFAAILAENRHLLDGGQWGPLPSWLVEVIAPFISAADTTHNAFEVLKPNPDGYIHGVSALSDHSRLFYHESGAFLFARQVIGVKHDVFRVIWADTTEGVAAILAEEPEAKPILLMCFFQHLLLQKAIQKAECTYRRLTDLHGVIMRMPMRWR